MTFRTLKGELDRHFAVLAQMHEQLCPKQVLGVRMGMLAATQLSLETPFRDKRVYCLVETDGCFVDGLSVVTDCTIGHRILRVVDYGKVAATFVDTQTMRAIRIRPHRASRWRASEYAPKATDRWHAQLTAYQVMPDEELFEWTSVTLTINLQELISRHGRRVNCADCGEDIINEREVITEGKILCRACALESYYLLERAESGPIPFYAPAE